jgi:hypothetical protein
MCIAIVNTYGTIDQATFQACWKNNPDGGGLAYVDNEEVRIFKEMNSVDAMYREYTSIRKYNDLPMIIHFRIATSGSVDADNCHPFEVFPGLVMAHNGIIDNVKAIAEISDTRIFIDQVLARLPENFLHNVGIRRLISEFIERSRLVFLNRFGVYDIINEHMGEWDNEHCNWFSNHTYTMLPTHRCQQSCNNSKYSYSHSYRSSFEDVDYNRDEMLTCECCGHIFHISELIYDQYWQAPFCEDCYDYLCQDEGMGTK